MENGRNKEPSGLSQFGGLAVHKRQISCRFLLHVWRKPTLQPDKLWMQKFAILIKSLIESCLIYNEFHTQSVFCQGEGSSARLKRLTR